MSYLNRWRNVRSLANTLAEGNSSEDDIARPEPRPSTAGDGRGNESNDVDVEVSSDMQELTSENDSDTQSQADCSSKSDSDADLLFDEAAESDEPTLREKLAEWATQNCLTRASVNELLIILRSENLDLPKGARTLLQTPKEIPIENKCGGKYAYFGLQIRIEKTLDFASQEFQNEVNLLVNIDGMPLFKSSGTQMWPIVCSFGKYRPFVVALFYGENKPDNLSDYLQDFLNEYDLIKDDGFVFNDLLIKVTIKAFVCDAPARSFLKCVKGHTGYYGCERCIIKGAYVDRRIIFLGDATARTDERFRNQEYNDHQLRVSPLSEVGFDCVSRFCLDYMHLVCLGVVKRIISFFRQGPPQCKLSQQQIGDISTGLLTFVGKLPSEFARQPRSLAVTDRWKATEFRQFLLYTGPVVLKRILHRNAYSHFLCLTVAVSILLDFH